MYSNKYYKYKNKYLIKKQIFIQNGGAADFIKKNLIHMINHMMNHMM